MAPVVLALAAEPDIRSTVCVTGQHREMLEPALRLFDVKPDITLNVMHPNQRLNALFARVLEGIDPILEAQRPDIVLVHGDTTTAAACALAAFQRQIPVGHVEAGLRTGDLRQPFPEELNRKLIDQISAWLFAPTKSAKANLMAEGLAGKIVVTGNTVIDSLAMMVMRIRSESVLNDQLTSRFDFLNASKRLVLVTGHRRENFGDGFEQICEALVQLATLDDVEVVYPVHLNPTVRDTVMARLGNCEHIHLIEPVNYSEFVWLMLHSALVLTDSGGVQEEGPYLGKPILVMRNVTERPEALNTGLVELLGTNVQLIVAAAQRRLAEDRICQPVSPYGDGRAAQRIVDALLGRPVLEFVPMNVQQL